MMYLADVETDKATMEVVGYEEGTLLYIGVEAGNAAKINEIIAIVGKAGTDVSAYVASRKIWCQCSYCYSANGCQSPSCATVAATATIEPTVSNTNQRIKASPLAKKLAADKGIDLLVK